MNLSPRANKGHALEATVIASAGRLLCLDKMGTQVRYLKGGATKAVKSPPDFIGTIRATDAAPARPICFDAKESAERYRWPIRAWAKARPLQREWILRHGEAGAVAGLLVEATKLETYFWLDWRDIRDLHDVASVLWDEDGEGRQPWFSELGPTSHLIDFAKVPGVVQEALAGRKGGL